MSIYALPGPLFKLVSNQISSPKQKETVEVSTRSPKDSSLEGQSSSSSLTSVGNPLHRKSGAPASTSLDVSDCPTGSASCNGGRNSNGNVVVAVKEAKIDPERLIRSLSLSGDSKKSKPSSDSSNEDATAASTSSSSQRRRRSKKGGKQGDGDDKCDPHEEAINFEFSVSFNGREYTAHRTLPRVLQFRTDLIEEFRARRMWQERRRKRKQSTPPPMSKVRDHSDDEEEEDKSIPELPRLSEDAAGSSGFTMLNALLRPYGPALDRWMKKVIDIVPHDSQCLTQFLWEPLSGNAATSRKAIRRRSSQSTLVAIQESDGPEQYDSDTDEYLLIH